MSRRIAILAALSSELKPLVRGWSRQKLPGHVWLWAQADAAGDEIVAACAGMGADAVRRAFLAVEQRGAIDLVLSVGLAGATGVAVGLGEVSCLSEVIDAQTGERFSLTEGKRRLRLVTVMRTADAKEKARLAATYGAVLVDMEAATVARLAEMRALPMCCFKAVSDTAEAEMPEIDRYVNAEGQLNIGRFLGSLALRPRMWGAVARLARGSRVASAALGKALREFLAHKEWEYTNRTGRFDRPRN